MANGELMVSTRPSGYVLPTTDGGASYGTFDSEQDALDARTELAQSGLVGTDAKPVPVLRAVRQGRRGRKPAAKDANTGNGVQVASAAGTATKDTKSPASAAAGTKN
jgi:hypothetical protein